MTSSCNIMLLGNLITENHWVIDTSVIGDGIFISFVVIPTTGNMSQSRIGFDSRNDIFVLFVLFCFPFSLHLGSCSSQSKVTFFRAFSILTNCNLAVF